ncbi:purine or other phosphorylase family 1 [Gluconacetobacter diazotrophicus PA1 5]|uniref:Uridine phosphorylase n=2 Tax=Gluconacetobacter diazotrophicus TaxID=33996 RepID=A9HPW0_GLUDA|nr:nucleoside phosphorylase [Gluconacetobacter diazotrophicus]ACI50696.1 purine or other phosphorylase family 1 [Gluconacetobacter diazotrophicus PA1 5]MBB2158145.1 nucleoside phosphorylase [Gluconacetobacter diazotrophicus]TWA99894.1 uridine phosphorylase [Gluconacetobacter diazotrophicus]CAP56639.1 putative uridine phosphorylase [Gluconacetobacter diazotrophicus PA1 5]
MSEREDIKTAWYIGATSADVGKVAILVGDPARVDRIALLLDDVHRVPISRGLQTITGTHAGRRVTVTAFGMGAPIAVVVMEELRALGVGLFLRIGTAMAAGPVSLGDFVVAEGALRREGTSASYAPAGYPALADRSLNEVILDRLKSGKHPYYSGVFASYDGFYSEMFTLPGARQRVRPELLADIGNYGLIAADMETSALLVAGRMLDARVSSLCMATVDPVTQAKLDAAATTATEHELFQIALDSVSNASFHEEEETDS